MTFFCTHRTGGRAPTKVPRAATSWSAAAETKKHDEALHVLRWKTLRTAVRTTAQFKVQGGASHHLGEERQAVSVRGAREGVTPRAMLVLGLRLEITHSEDADDDDINSEADAFAAVLHSRMQMACAIFLSKYSIEGGDVMLLSGGRNVPGTWGNDPRCRLPTESALMLSFALDAGIPRSSIELLQDGCINSVEVAISVKQLLSKWGVDRLAVVTSDLTLNRATTIFSTLLPTFTTRFHAAPCPSLHVEHVDLIAEQEGKLMAVLREDLSAYLEYLEAGGVWPPRDAAHTKT